MDKIAILVSSFDAYAACWKPFCHGFNKYWPQHPPLYFITNFIESGCGHSLKLGPDRGWTDNISAALAQIETPYILYTQEDYWLKQPVDESLIANYLTLIENDQADYIRLIPERVALEEFPGHPHLGILPQSWQYRTSLHMALWRKSVLLDLLVAGENAWQFEVQGSIRSRKYANRFLCTKPGFPAIYYTASAVVKGEWSRIAKEYAQKEGITIAFEQLPVTPFPKRQMRMVRRTLKMIKKRLTGQV